MWWLPSLSRACRRGKRECGGSRGEYRTAHTRGGPRHQGKPLSLMSRESQVPRSTVSWDPLRCCDYARFPRFPVAFHSLAAVTHRCTRGVRGDPEEPRRAQAWLY
jgi:hypothetical protein